MAMSLNVCEPNQYFKAITSIQLPTASTRVVWDIKNYDLICRLPAGSVRSPEFKFSDSTWTLVAHSDDFDNNIRLSLVKITGCCKNVNLHFVMKDKDGGKRCIFPPHNLEQKNFAYIYSWADQLLPKEVLIVECLLTSEMPIVNSFITVHLDRNPDFDSSRSSDEALAEDLKNLFETGQNSDLILKVNDEEFKVHKSILGARSSVFAAMFSHDMLENRNNVVVIEDIETSIVSDFLRYIYTGRVNHQCMENATALFKAADKYNLETLKVNCLKFMLTSLSVDNFCYFALLIYDHQIEKLKNVVSYFFKENMSKILSSNLWKQFKSERLDAAVELMESIILAT